MVVIRVWVTLIQQDGGEAILKDKLDPPPVGSGLDPDTFVLCIQTNFQKEQFQRLGSNFVCNARAERNPTWRLV